MGEAGIARQEKYLRDTKLFDESSAARRSAVQQAHKEHVLVGKSKKMARKTGDPRRQTASRKVQSTGDVDALVPRPERLSKDAIGYEVQFDRLYNSFPALKHRTEVRFVQSMLRKYGYNHATLKSQAPAHEYAAFTDAMKVVKSLSDSMKRR